MKTAIYPGSFNPFTLGHLDIVRRSLKLFDTLFIAVAESQTKNTILTMQKRADLIKEVILDEKLQNRVKVLTFDSMLINLASYLNVFCIIRGCREASEWNRESNMASINHHLDSRIETLILPASTGLNFISSTVVRNILLHNGNIDHLVPQAVQNFFKKQTNKDIQDTIHNTI